MSDNSVASKMAAQYKIEMPSFNFPESAPVWFTSAFPTIIQSIYEGFNGVLKKVIADFNDSYVEMQKQIDELSKLTKEATDAMNLLKSQLQERDYIIEEQTEHISGLNNTLDRNEAYSRRDNLIFGGIAHNAQGSCSDIVQNILKCNLNISDPSIFTFVRCHYLRTPTNDSKGSIIVRFHSFSQRMMVWNNRRLLLNTNYFVSEDYPSSVSKKRNKLRPILKEASKHKDFERCISIRHDQLFFKGELYNVNNLHKLPTCIHPRTLSEKRSKGILCFGGILSEYHEFSNFFKCGLTYKNIKFNSVEQAYQYCKALLFGDDRTAYLILCAVCPTKIKLLGKGVSGFDAVRWNGGREKLMRQLVGLKFSQNPDLKQKLCETGTMHLAEANRSDSFFGIGVSIAHPSCLQRSNWSGSNVLGEALMDTRRELRRTL